MAQNQSNTAFRTQGTENIGAYSGTSHTISEDATNTQQIVANLSSTQTNAQTVKQLINSFKPFANALIAAAGKIGSEKVSEIAGAVWDEFKALTPFQKVLVVLVTAIVVGAVGYFSWKLIAGNWDKIKGFLEDQMKKLDELKNKAVASIEKNLFIKRIANVFEKEVETPTIKETDINAIIEQFIKFGGAGFIAAFAEWLKTNQ